MSNIVKHNYLNISSMVPLSKKQAYKIACDRFQAHTNETRDNYSGIVLPVTGAEGVEKYVDWEDLPPATHSQVFGKLK